MKVVVMTQNRPDMSRIRDLMAKHSIDILAAAYPSNVFYLSDLPVLNTASNALLYCVKNSSPVFCLVPLDGGEPILITTAAAVELARRHSWIKDIRPYKTGVYIVRSEDIPVYADDAVSAFAKTLESIGGGKKLSVGLDISLIPNGLFERIKKNVSKINFVDATEIFYSLRMVKNAEEIMRFREANRILCNALKKVISEIREGVVERDLHVILKTEILKEGGDGWFQTTIASGPESGPNIYHQPDGRRLRKGDIIRLDVGCVYRGFGCDLSRTVSIGPPPAEAKKIYSVLEEAEKILIDNAVPGVKASELYLLAEKYVREKLDVNYTRGNLGHGVGVELYDPPEISRKDDTPLRAGMTLSLEVPYHKYGLGGFNIEDSVLITESGKEVVSDLPRELIVV